MKQSHKEIIDYIDEQLVEIEKEQKKVENEPIYNGVDKWELLQTKHDIIEHLKHDIIYNFR